MENKFIHLLYVPTMACNMNCKYCYLEDNTKDNWQDFNSLETLKYAIKKFKSQMLSHLIFHYTVEKLQLFLKQSFMILLNSLLHIIMTIKK